MPRKSRVIVQTERIGDRAAKCRGAYADSLWLDPHALVHEVRSGVPSLSRSG